MCVSRHFVWDRSNDNQPQMPSCGAASPEDIVEDFVTDLATFGTKVDARVLPFTAIRLANVLRREELDGILTPRIGKSRQTEPGIFTATGQQIHSRDRRLEEGAITEAAVDWDQQLPISGAFLIQQLAKASNQIQSGGRKIFILAQRAVLLQLVFGGGFPWLAHDRHVLKADGKSASREGSFLVMGKHERCLEEPQSPNEVDVKGRRHRIALPGCSGNVSARFMHLRVIHRHHDRSFRIPFQIFIDDGIKQLFCIPGASRIHLIVGAPVLLGSAQHADVLRNGAVAHGRWPRQRVLDSAAVRPPVGKYVLPLFIQYRDIPLSQRHDGSPLSAKTFLSVRRNRSPRAIFLTKEDTTDSRSRRRPCSFSTRSRMSDICRGLPARRSTSYTMSICDVRLSGAGSTVPLDLARRIARNWASRAISKALRTACSIGSSSCAFFFTAQLRCAKTCGYSAVLTYVCQ